MTDLAPPPQPPRKKRIWLRWLIVLVVIVALGVAAWIIGDRIARDYAVGVIRDQLLVAFPTSDPQVTIGPGSVLSMAIAGSLTDVHVDLGSTDFGEISGDVTLDASGVPLDSTKSINTLDITFDLAQSDVQKVITNLDGLENADVSLADDKVALASSLSVFGASVPLGISFTTSAADGALVLTPATVSVNNAEISLTDLSSGPLGPIVSSIVKPQTVCVASYLPAVLTLTDATVANNSLRLDISGSNIALTGTDFEQLGSC